MFVVRQEAMDRMRSEHLDELVRRIGKFLSEQFKDSTEIPVAEFHQEIRLQVEKALAYGFRNEQQIATFVLTAWLTGTNFDVELAEARQILNADEEPEVRIGALEKWSRDLFQEE